MTAKCAVMHARRRLDWLWECVEQTAATKKSATTSLGLSMTSAWRLIVLATRTRTQMTRISNVSKRVGMQAVTQTNVCGAVVAIDRVRTTRTKATVNLVKNGQRQCVNAERSVQTTLARPRVFGVASRTRMRTTVENSPTPSREAVTAPHQTRPGHPIGDVAIAMKTVPH